jgi:ParB-like chromosome segregation protein Spo0J
MTIEKIAKRVGRKPSRVKRMLDIVKMPVDFQKAIHKNQISPTVAEALWRCEDETHRDYLLELAIEHGVTAVVAAQWVQDHRKEKRESTAIKNEGGGESTPFEGKTHYMTCDLCQGPEDTSKIKQVILCATCHKQLSGAIKKGE